MKGIKKILLLGSLAAFMALPCWNAEAANVVVLPLVNNVNEDNELNQVYYNRAMKVAEMGGHEIFENSQIEALVEKNVPKGSLATEEALRAIADNSDADIIVGMQLDKLDYVNMPYSKENIVKLQLEGYGVYYNKLTDKFKMVKIVDDRLEEEPVAIRADWLPQQWSNNVIRHFRRAMDIKKINIEKPRLTKLR